MSATAIEARSLVVTLGNRRVLDGLALSVQAGTVYALLGSNGAGKTTTLQVLLGFVSPEAGEVLVQGRSPMRHADEVRRTVAYLPENVALYPYLSGIENLRYFCALAGLNHTASAAAELLVRAGLPAEAANQRTGRYSKGMRQKVGLAIAHAKRAQVLLLDEPTSGLDPVAAHELAQQLRACADAGMAVLMVTHDVYNARHVADRIGILRAGRVVERDAAAMDMAQLERLYHAPA